MAAIPPNVRICVEIYVICDRTGARGCIRQRLDRLPRLSEYLSDKQAAFALRDARSSCLMAEPRLMSADETAQFLGAGS